MEQGARLNHYLARLQQGDDETQAFTETFGPLPELQTRFDQFRRILAPPALRLKDLPACDEQSFALRTLPDEEWTALAASFEIPEHFSHSPAALPHP